MKNAIETLVGQTAAKLLLYLFHYGEAYPTGAAKDMELRQSAVQRQLAKLEEAGFLISKLAGNTRLYTFNPKNPATGKLKDLVGVFYQAMSLAERERIFNTRRRPRRAEKPVKTKRR